MRGVNPRLQLHDSVVGAILYRAGFEYLRGVNPRLQLHDSVVGAILYRATLTYFENSVSIHSTKALNPLPLFTTFQAIFNDCGIDGSASVNAFNVPDLI